MFHYKSRKLAFPVIAGFACIFALTQRVFAVGYPVAADPNCDQNCRPTCCQQFCRTLKLHCVYFKRSCCQKFILVPTSQAACPPGFVPVDCPTYSSPFTYPTINGYGVPPVNPGPNGVFLH